MTATLHGPKFYPRGCLLLPPAHSSLILGVFCGMTNEGFWEDFLLPSLNNSDREKESSPVIFLSHGPRLAHLVMSNGDKAPPSAGEKVSQGTESTNLAEVFKRQPETMTVLPASYSFSSSLRHFFLISVMSFSFFTITLAIFQHWSIFKS